MITAEFLSNLDMNFANIVDTGKKLDWINELEQDIYSRIVKEIYIDTRDIVSGQDEYTLPHYIFEDIIKAMINGAEYKKGVVTNPTPSTFYKKNGKLAIFPIPQEDISQAMKIYHRYKPVHKTIINMDTEELTIPSMFQNLYEYYLCYKICTFNKDFEEAGNWLTFYNSRFDEFKKWYYENLPIVIERR